MNLLYFLTKGTDGDLAHKYFPFLVIWSLATVAYPQSACKIAFNPEPTNVNQSYRWIEGGRAAWLNDGHKQRLI